MIIKEGRVRNLLLLPLIIAFFNMQEVRGQSMLSPYPQDSNNSHDKTTTSVSLPEGQFCTGLSRSLDVLLVEEQEPLVNEDSM